MSTDSPIFEYSVDLYKLSQYPEFAALYELFARVAHDHRAPFPRTRDQKVAYESSCAVGNTIREIIDFMNTEILVGKRISEPPEDGGEANAEDSRHNERRRA